MVELVTGFRRGRYCNTASKWLICSKLRYFTFSTSAIYRRTNLIQQRSEVGFVGRVFVCYRIDYGVVGVSVLPMVERITNCRRGINLHIRLIFYLCIGGRRGSTMTVVLHLQPIEGFFEQCLEHRVVVEGFHRIVARNAFGAIAPFVECVTIFSLSHNKQRGVERIGARRRRYLTHVIAIGQRLHTVTMWFEVSNKCRILGRHFIGARYR